MWQYNNYFRDSMLTQRFCCRACVFRCRALEGQIRKNFCRIWNTEKAWAQCSLSVRQIWQNAEPRTFCKSQNMMLTISHWSPPLKGSFWTFILKPLDCCFVKALLESWWRISQNYEVALLGWCRFMWSARWSDLEKLLSHCAHLNGLTPVCFRWCLVSSSDLAKRHSQPSQGQR